MERPTHRSGNADQLFESGQAFTDRRGDQMRQFGTATCRNASVMDRHGAERRGRTDLYKPTEVGKLLGVIHIRYVEPEALERAQQ